MNHALGLEQRFIADVEARRWEAGDVRDDLKRLDDWLDRVSAAMTAHPLRWPGLADDHPLAIAAQAVHDGLSKAAQHWRDQRRDLEATQAVADAMAHRALFLVFGKFNAGKSSLCNFLADRFRAQGEPVEYLGIDHGELVVRPGGRFAEGATETTTTLQGVRLGRHLVLLDTPGLHSTALAHAALARRFTDSADGVLWLTSSTSPGQVQELEALGRELRRHKPLLPVITRSDCIEEDEVDGAIVKVLRNKTPANRALQEADVQQRGRQKLVQLGAEPALLRPPVSVSSHAARQEGQTAAALQAAGFDRLWAALQDLVGPALAYKRRKSAEIVLHHAEEAVLQALDEGLAPQLASLSQALVLERAALAQRQAALAKRVWRAVAPALPALLERHAEAGDVRAVCAATEGLLAEAFATAAGQAWAGFPAAFGVSTGALSCGDGVDFDAGHERLHAALVQSLLAALNEAAAAAAARCEQALEGLDASLQALQVQLAHHRHALAAIKARLRAEG